MNWQTATALTIVALAAAGLFWGLLRRRKFSFQRDTHCGCSTPSHSSRETSVIFQARKGERPQVIVKTK